ncbi:hypothetical protein K438DRAFT_192753 [Mycena galopus ATCC 62051]|nr:hypothetical protein K438DRAFT_192753 [Mycena galopus ATCC 62051]
MPVAILVWLVVLTSMFSCFIHFVPIVLIPLGAVSLFSCMFPLVKLNGIWFSALSTFESFGASDYISPASVVCKLRMPCSLQSCPTCQYSGSVQISLHLTVNADVNLCSDSVPVSSSNDTVTFCLPFVTWEVNIDLSSIVQNEPEQMRSLTLPNL